MNISNLKIPYTDFKATINSKQFFKATVNSKQAVTDMKLMPKQQTLQN